MTLDEDLRSYMLAFHHGVGDRIWGNQSTPESYHLSALAKRGYEAGLIAFDVAERVERQRLEQVRRDADAISG